MIVDNPFLACTCRGLLLGADAHPLTSVWREHLSQEQVEEVRERLLFCRCHMRESKDDPSGLFRIGLLSHLLSLADKSHDQRFAIAWKDIK